MDLAKYGFGGNTDTQIIFDAMKRMWTTNGDRLSQQYAGTPSNITGVIENGKQGLAGKFGQMMTGVHRYIVNNWSDGEKHECIKVILNGHPGQKPYGI